MSSSYNYEKALSLEWNGQVYVLTVRNETPIGGINYLYSSDGVSWYSSSDLSNSQLLTQSNPFNVKWTGTNFAMVGNVANVGGNTILRSGAAGTKFSALSTAGQGTNAPLYDLEANLEFPHTITFPRNTTLALGGAPADTTKIAYSLDAGITWTPSANSSAVFSVTANNAVWNGKIWVAVGQGGNTIATSVDGNTWIGRGAYIFTVAGQGIAWSPQQALWVAAGQGTNSLAYSVDGVYWTGLGTAMLGSGADVQWNGTVWSAVGGPNATNKSISYSYDGKNWSNPTQSNLFDITGIKTAWNGYFWTAIGSSTPANNIYNIGTSVDGIFWFMQKNTNFSSNITNMFTNPTATNEIIFTTYGQVPGAPTALTYVSNNTTSVSFSFTAPVGGVTPTSYTVSAVPLSGQTISQTFAYGGTTGTITGLTSATSYTISLYSNGSTGSSVASNSITTQTTLIPPTNLTFVSYTTSSINISFTPPPLSSGVTVTSYNATAVPASGSTVIVTGISGAGTSASITGLVASTQYSITLTATNSYGTSASSTALVYQTSLSPPYNLLASMVDTSSVSLSFVAPTLGTNVTVTSYTATFVPTTGPNITVNNITSSPVAVNGLTFSMNYNITMVAINSYGTSAASAIYNYTLTTLLVITGVTSGSTGAGLIAGNVTNDMKSGTSTTNNVTYNVYSFQPGTSILPSVATSSQATYTINYNTGGSTLIYVLAVGGGGGAGTFCGGGGGAGGVVMNSVTLPSGTGTISVNVGAGGLGQGTSGANYATPVPVNGSNTTVSFSANTNANIIAYGGGFGQGLNNTTGAGNGGSGGGAGNNGGLLFGKAINQYNNYGNPGSLLGGANSQGCGGGGAGNVGTQNLVAALGAASNGGPGIQCFLPGISTFAPSGTPYGTYYWGGGGGGGGNASQSGNGGIGGGGGGGSSGATTTFGGTGGGLALNAGGNGTYSDLAISGAGGTNTGGGGGGSVHNIAASGGSGIVVIAFPSNMLITNNGAAVLPSSIYGSGIYGATLNNASFSVGAYSSIKGAFACRLLNYNYFGPVVTLRYSTDTTGSYTQNFYSDICGNMGTGYLGTGQSVSSWLSSNSANTTYAFVTKWYDQGMDVSFNSATQYTTTYQPIYDVSYGVLNYGYTGVAGGVIAPQTAYLNLPLNAFPILDSSFTVVTKYWNYGTNNSDTQGDLIDVVANSQGGAIKQNTNGTPGIWLSGANMTAANALGTSNQVLSYKYTSFSTIGNQPTNYVIYQNTNQTATGNRTAAFTTAQYLPSIGNSQNSYYANNGLVPNPSYYLQAQLYYLYVFGLALTDTDRNLVEATPSLYAPLPQMTITLSSVAAANFVATWANVTNATTYIAYINGTAYGTVTSGQPITPVINGPWATTIYAYDTNNKLLARGYVNAFVLNINSVVAGSTGTGLIAGNPVTDVISGTSTTNGITYNVYSFQPGTAILPPAASSSQATYTINYTCTLATTIYVLAVGGGGPGNSNGGGGGGAGGVVMKPVTIPAGTNTINISVAAGAVGIQTGSFSTGYNGGNTTVNFTANTTANIIALGGGAGSGVTSNLMGAVGGSGGGGNYQSNGAFVYNANTNNNNFGNPGGPVGNSYYSAGGGGGAGTVGLNPNTSNGATGGNGIQCFLPGIKDFAPSGINYGTYYWGGGGGGGGVNIGPGNGGLGGGGGGSTNLATGNVGYSGKGGINNSADGKLSDTAGGGAGGANTGGGGGGACNAATGGAGGSGIVIIAFPSNAAITNNQAAVLPSALVSSGQYNATLNNASFSVGAYNSGKGAFACRLLNYNYFGPIMTLRYSTDTLGIYTQNFYSDICGNMGMGYLGTGTPLSTWLSSNGANTTYAYVTKWYGQGMDVSFNSATQYTLASQPIYDVSNCIINLGYTGAGGGVAAPQTNCYFNLPNGALPYNDSSYNYTIRHWNVTSSAAAVFITGGTATSNPYSSLCGLAINLKSQYCQNWYGNDFNGAASKYTAPGVVTFKYTSGAGTNSRINYINYASTGYSESNTPSSIRNQTNIQNYIGYNVASGWSNLNGQLYNLYISNSALTDTDRNLIEATPYQYSVLPTITGLTSTTISANSFTLSWTAVASVSYYILWINGTIFATYNAPAITTGTVTHSSSGPWQINLYAYNASNVLLASGYMTTTIVMASASVSINSGASTAANGANTVFTFASSGTFTPLTSGFASVLIVGGGGGGAYNCAGGGGAGGLIYFDASARPMFLTAGTTYTITVGSGGIGATGYVATAPSTYSGGNSSLIGTGVSYIANGGGCGGESSSYYSGGAGGCGGGAGNSTTSYPGSSNQTYYANTYYVGRNSGGANLDGTNAGGGGGGAGGTGGAGGAGTGGAGANTGGAGGSGYLCNITGTNSFYAGGGGGGSINPQVGGSGGSGVGGNGGGQGTVSPTAGAANTGSGGGGGTSTGTGTTAYGAAGSAGVVIISCPGIPAIAGLSASSVTATTFVLSWTTVTNAASYVLNINGTNYGTSYGVVTTTGTVTPGVSGPWTVTLSAYNSGSVLLAMSYLPTNSFNTISPINQLFYYTFDTSTINSSYTLSSTFTSGMGVNPTLANIASGTAVYDGNLSFTGGGPNAISTYISTTTLKNGTASLYCSGNFSFNFSKNKSAYSIGTNGITFSWWMNTAMTTFSSPCVWTIGGGNSQNQNGTGQYGIWCQLNSATNLTFYTYNNSSNASVTLSATCSTITNGTWQYFCFTLNSSGTANVYQNNGIIVTNGTFYYPFTTSNINQWDTIAAGVNNGNFLSGNFYTGYIDNFRVYQRVITSSEASILYLCSS